MKIINKIYIWFKKVILNILGVIRDMINENNKYEVEIMKTKYDMAKYIIEKGAYGAKYIIEKGADGIKYVFGSRKVRLALSVALLISCFDLPDDKGVKDNENRR